MTAAFSDRAFRVWAQAYAAALPACMQSALLDFEHEQTAGRETGNVREQASVAAADMADRAVRLAENRGALTRPDPAAVALEALAEIVLRMQQRDSGPEQAPEVST